MFIAKNRSLLPLKRVNRFVKSPRKRDESFKSVQQRRTSERFLTAIGLIQEGRIGRVKKVTCNIGSSPKGGPFKKSDPPSNIDWNMWLGQAPMVDYIKERCHYQFRWWYEYSGGKMTDWGAHHVDIAQWAIQQNGVGAGS